MAATIFYTGASEFATLTNVFSVNSVATDPTTVSCVITDPTGVATVHTYLGAAPADISRNGTGSYQLLIACSITGLWGYAWIGTGSAADVQAGTWTVQPNPTGGQFYVSMEELKDRLRISDTADDMSLLFAVQSAARWVEGHCGRYFWQGPDTRTYVPYDIYELPIDDLVSITSLKCDFDGDGVFEQVWVQGVDYELATNRYEFNQMVTGEQRPYTLIRVINNAGGGKFFPYTWPFSRLDRIQIVGQWGWPAVPLAVKQAALQLATDFYKFKDAPFGLAGSADLGVVHVSADWMTIMTLLTRYVHSRRQVGI
jgi:hypothetical protein